MIFGNPGNTASTDGAASAVDEAASAGKAEIPTSSDVVTEGTGEIGSWQNANESMSDASRKYQHYITGVEDGMVYNVSGVRFDGYKDGILLEAKGNYSNFVNKNGEFHKWFAGAESLVNQGRRQLAVAEGNSIKWFFNDSTSLEATRRLFENRNIRGIELVLDIMPR